MGSTLDHVDNLRRAVELLRDPDSELIRPEILALHLEAAADHIDDLAAKLIAAEDDVARLNQQLLAAERNLAALGEWVTWARNLMPVGAHIHRPQDIPQTREETPTHG